jgi:TRAP-type C4-dicarboxylate transport system substrate-binding protein
LDSDPELQRKRILRKEEKMKKAFALAVTVAFLAGLSVSLDYCFAASEKPIELRYSMFISTQHMTYTEVWAPWAQELERRSQGRVKVTFYPSEALGKAKDHYNMAVTGVADIALCILGYTPGRFPLSEIIELPILWPSGKIGSRIAWELYERYMKKEFSDVKLIQFGIVDPYHIMTAKKPVKSLADMSGLRLRSGNPRQAEMLRAWGASPINITVFDTYDSLQKGMVDGLFMNYSSLRDYKLDEQLNHYTTLNMGAGQTAVAMSLKAWNSLPPDIQKIVDEISGFKISVKVGAAFDKSAKEGFEQALKKGDKAYTLPEAERAAFVEKTKPIVDKWLANAESKGLPGKQVYQEILSLVEKYAKE